HVRKWKAHGGLAARLPENSPASRTRCWWLAPREPRWTYRASLLEKPMLYPPLNGTASACATTLGSAPSQAAKKRTSVTHGRVRRTHTAWAASGRVRYARLLKPPPPVPRQ